MTSCDEILPLITVLLRLLDQCDHIQPDSEPDESGVLAATHQVRQALAESLPPPSAVQVQQTERLDRLSDLVILAVNACGDWVIADAIDARTLTLRDVRLRDGLAVWIARVFTLTMVEPLASKEAVYRSLHQTFQAAQYRIETIQSVLKKWEPPNEPPTTIDDVLAVVDMVDNTFPALIPAELELELNTFIRTKIIEVLVSQGNIYGSDWSKPMAWMSRYRGLSGELATGHRQLDDLVAAMVADEDMTEL